MPLNIKSQGAEEIKLFPLGTDDVDSQDLSYETLTTADYNNVKIFSFVMVGIKLWLIEDGDLHTDHFQYSFKSVDSKVKIYVNCCLLLAITLQATHQSLTFLHIVIINGERFISKFLKVAYTLAETFDFFSPLGFHIQRDSDLRRLKIKLHLVGASNHVYNRETSDS